MVNTLKSEQFQGSGYVLGMTEHRLKIIDIFKKTTTQTSKKLTNKPEHNQGPVVSKTIRKILIVKYL